MEKDIRITDHAEKRIRKRLGLNKKSVEKNAAMALKFGITHAEAIGQLKQYINKLFLSGASKRNFAGNIRIFNHFVYIFAGNTLVTVIKLPKNLEETENSIKCKKMIENSKTSEIGGITSIDN